MTETHGNATGGGGKGRTRSLEKLDGDPLGRLAKGVRDQETIVVCGPPMWERIELLDILAKSIPENRRVIVLEDRARSEPRLREDALPPNHVILNYNIPDVRGVSLADIAKAALRLTGDYIILPNLGYGDIEVFQRYIAHAFEGIIVAVDAFEENEAVRSIADVLIRIVSDKSAPFGIGSVWTRPAAAVPLEAIPAQNAGPHFVISTAGQISPASASPLDTHANDIRRIRQLLPLVRQSADDIAARLNQNNAFTELVRDITRYRNAISRPESEIAWGLVWGLGVRLEATAAAAEREISDRLAPALEDTELAALQSLRFLHAPLILATVEGRELQEQADQLRMTRDEQATLRADAVALSVSLRQNEDIIIEPDAAAIVEEAAGAIGEGRHPERGTAFGIATITHMLIVLISAAVIAAPSYFIGGVLGKGLTMGTWEAMKKSPIFAAATAVLSLKLNRLLESGGMAAQRLLSRLAPFRRFVRANESHLRRIAANTPQLRWMLAYLDYIVRTDL